jgi:hypothetical protein
VRSSVLKARHLDDVGIIRTLIIGFLHVPQKAVMFSQR